MFTRPITLNDGAANHVYDTVVTGDYKTVNREALAAIDKPATLTISHQQSGSGSTAKVRSLIRCDRVTEDALANQGLNVAYAVIEWNPKVTTAADVKKTIAELIAFLSASGFQDKILNLEV